MMVWATSDEQALRLEPSGHLAENFRSPAQRGCFAWLLALGTGSEMTELLVPGAPLNRLGYTSIASRSSNEAAFQLASLLHDIVVCGRVGIAHSSPRVGPLS